jgi:ABC-type dipeptide/oligopeptide/nickel transport system permease subunit
MSAGDLMPTAELEPAGRRRPRESRRRRSRVAIIGFVGLGAVIALVVLGPFVAPHDPDVTAGSTYMHPTGEFLLGTDALGRDVTSRVLTGGQTVLMYAAVATVLAYIAGLALGMLAGFVRGSVDNVVMRIVDVLLAFPTLVFVLLLAAAFGRGMPSIVFATALIQATAVARIIRTATLEQSVRGFVEAAVARGERTHTVLIREILPNIAPTLAADVGLRFTWSVLLLASVNFLGLGLQPPTADWGLMISENRGGMDLNPLAVLAPAAISGALTVSINVISDAWADKGI